MTNPLILTVIGMGVTMIILYIISLMIVGLGKLFAQKTVPSVPAIPEPAPAAQPAAAESNDAEIIAAIMGAVYACIGDGSRPALRVRPLASSGSQAAWVTASRAENILLK